MTLKFILTLFAGFLTTFMSCSESILEEKIEAPRLTILSENFEEVLPSKFWEPPISIELRPLTLSESDRADYALKKFILKYPSGLVNFFTKGFVFTKYLSVNDSIQPYGILDRYIFILVLPEESGSTASFIEKELHFNFSILLWKSYGNDSIRELYESQNQPSFQYADSIPEHIERDGSKIFDLEPQLYSEGFTSWMSRLGFEHDFFGLSTQLFAGNPDFFDAIPENPILEKKVNIIIDYYQKIDSIMDSRWFFEWSFNMPPPPDSLRRLVPKPSNRAVEGSSKSLINS